MEHGLDSDSNAAPVSIDKSRVLDVKPLRCLVPIFPSPSDGSPVSTPQPSPFVCVPPSGPFPAGVQPFYPFLAPKNTQNTTPGAETLSSNLGPNANIPAPVPLNSYRTPVPQTNGSASRPKRSYRTRASESVVIDDNGQNNDSQSQSEKFVSGFSMHVADAEVGGSSSEKRSTRLSRRRSENGDESNVDSLVNGVLTSFKLEAYDEFRRANGDKDTVGTILLVFSLLRRRLTQLEEAKDSTLGIKRPDLKACNLLMTKGIRTNHAKRIGHVPGVEVGDIFFFRMELCLVGLHAPSMAGIDYMSVRLTNDEDPVAVSIVSSGGYDDDGDDGDVLVYSGHGGQQRDGQTSDQKLERGNLALEKSLHRANDVRVIRGVKDINNSNGKFYIYDGLYKIQESWAEKSKSGCNVFKYKLVRVPGQPQAFSLWKSIQQWKDGTATRSGIILPDLTSGAESQPVALVNDVDGEKGPAHFTYIPNLKYSKPFSTLKPSLGCHCTGGCQPGDINCPCIMRNGGDLPYSALGVLMTNKSLIHECGLTCSCPRNCRNRISQAGARVRFEVFKTGNRGWGLRSRDPIRSGSFICEYAGEVIEAFDYDDSFIFDSTRYFEPLEAVRDDPANYKKSPFPLVISAKNSGNVARFMNHSCSPNVIWQPVLRESNKESYLHVAFFAIRHIPPMQELTFDYGMVQPEKGDKGKKKCLCGSAKCKGYFY